MTALLLTLNQPQAYGYLEAGAIVTVRRLSDVEGTVTPWWIGRQTVDVVGGTGESRRDAVFELPGGGSYGITVTRPRSTDFEREVFVNDGEERRETVVLRGSPHEYLAWHQFVGKVSSAASLQPENFDFARAPDPQLFAVSSPAPINAWRLDVVADRPDPGSALRWRRQQDPAYTTWPLSPPREDGARLLERLRQPESGWRYDPLSTKYPRWVAVRVDDHADLVSIPWAWWGASEPKGLRMVDDEGIRIVYTRNEPDPIDSRTLGHTMLTVQDSRWFSLLEFLSSNRVAAVADLMDEVLKRDGPFAAVEALDGKVKGPLSAVAGALVLVIRTRTNERQDWDGWLENLANWFEGIPDGPIILAYRRLSQAKTRAELERVHGWLRTGIKRGIPYFSATISMLMQGLTRLANDLPEADNDRRLVGRVSSRVDPNQPFTVIRL